MVKSEAVDEEEQMQVQIRYRRCEQKPWLTSGLSASMGFFLAFMMLGKVA